MIIFGTGVHARKVYYTAIASGRVVDGFLTSYRAPTSGLFLGAVVFEDVERMAREGPGDMFVAVGSPTVRRAIIEKFVSANWKMINLVHPKAYVSPDVVFGGGVFIGAGAIVETLAIVGRGAIIDVGATIDHEVVIEEFEHVRPGEIRTKHGR